MKTNTTRTESLEDELTRIRGNARQAMSMIEAVRTAIDPSIVQAGYTMAPESAVEVLEAVHELLSDGVLAQLETLVKEEIDAVAVQQ